MTGEVHAILVDDNPEDLKVADRLTRGDLHCEGVLAPLNADELRRKFKEFFDGAPGAAVVILDYRLDDVAATAGSRPSYRGGTIAAELKEQNPEVPVVLLTTEEKFHDWVEARPQVQDLFDHLVLKRRVARSEERDAVAAELVDLARGFVEVASVVKDISWDALIQLLGGDAQDFGRLQETSPDLPSTVGEVTHWMLKSVLKFPGPLVDAETAAALAGVEANSFSDSVQAALSDARYVGPFATLLPRWWRRRIVEQFEQLKPGLSVETAADRASALEAKDAASVPAARCAWCGEGMVDRCCSVCHQAVDAAHSVGVVIDARPAWADLALACYRCIQTGRADDVRFAPGSSRIVDALRSGDLTDPLARS